MLHLAIGSHGLGRFIVNIEQFISSTFYVKWRQIFLEQTICVGKCHLAAGKLPFLMHEKHCNESNLLFSPERRRIVQFSDFYSDNCFN